MNFDSSIVTTSHERRESEAVAIAEWMIDNNCTIKQLSKEFMIPATTVWRRLTVTLKDVNYSYWRICQRILKEHDKASLERARSKKQKRY